MGRAHALSGAAAWMVGAPLLSHTTGWFTLDTATWLTGAVVTAGAALAPDLDHPGASSASNSLKPVTSVLSQAVSVVSFGHRKLTHSLLGTAIFAALMLLATGPFAPWGVVVVAFLLTAFAVKAVGLPKVLGMLPIPFAGTVVTVVAGAAMAWVTVDVSNGDYAWFLYATACGFFIHILGDAITIMGVPLLWPLPKDFRLAPLRAGGTVEMMVLTPLFVALIVWAGWSVFSSGSVLGHPVASPAKVTEQVAPAPAPTPGPSPSSKPKDKKKAEKQGKEQRRR